jgi:hypothetical protein
MRRDANKIAQATDQRFPDAKMLLRENAPSQTDSTEACRQALLLAEQQLHAAQALIDEQRSRNEALVRKLLNTDTKRRADPHAWGLEPGVGL